MKLNEEQIEAVCRLLGDRDFKVLFSAMSDYAEGLNQRLVMQKMDTGDLHNLQGQTRNMVIILEAISDAPTKKAELSQPKT